MQAIIIFLIVIVTPIIGIVWLCIKAISFIFEPFKDIATSILPTTKGQQEEDNKPMEVVIKDNNVDTSRIVEYIGEISPTFAWYPETLEQFVGQEEAKEQTEIICEKMKRNMKAHLIISALQGSGKSTFIRLLADKLNAHLIERIGKQVDSDGLIDIINEINLCEKEYVIFFLDEIDTTDHKVIKILNPIIQDFKINDKRIKPFIFASATINKDILVKNNPDTLDRIPHHIQFKRYTVEELNLISNQYISQLYSNENLNPRDITKIAKNCKYNPRLVLSILEDYIVTNDIDKTFKNRRIIINGLTDIDIDILKVLNESEKPMGSNAIALRVGLNQKQYEREFEPFLYYEKYINRTPSRIISLKGKEILRKLAHE